MAKRKITKIKDAQQLVKNFAKNNGWKDYPNIDKFDHLHEELIEMSQSLRYKSQKEMTSYIKENPEIFIDGIGDLFFGTCRLANQLGVDLEEAFNFVSGSIVAKYHKKPETKPSKKK